MKAVVAGYYGFGNVGDDLLARATVEAIRRREPKAEISLLSNSPALAASLSVRFAPRWNPGAVAGEIFSCDRFVFGGGGIFQDATSARSMLYYLGILFLARFMRKPVGLANVGVDPIRSPLLSAAFRFLIPSASAAFRDAASREAAGGLGAVTADGVFTLPAPPPSAVDPSRVLFVVRAPPASSGILWAVVKRLTGRAVRFAVFQPGADEEAARDLRKGENALVTADRAMEVVSSAAYVVSARYHALVLAAIAGRPFLGIGDPGKIRSLCDAFGAPYLPWSATDTEVEAAMDRLFASPPPDPALVEEFRRKSDDGFDIALM